MKMVFALAALHGMFINFGDTANAFQQSPPPEKLCYIAVDEAYHCYGECLIVGEHVLPLCQSLQGHPEAGASFEKLINSLLLDGLGLKNITHEKNLYSGEIAGKRVLVCCQIDNYAIASTDPAASAELFCLINARITTDDLGMGT